MTSSDKIRVAVLFGGRSAEHEVSLQSAKNVIQNLDTSRFEIIPVGIDKQGSWFLGDDLLQHSLQHNQVRCLPTQASAWFSAEWVSKPATATTQNNNMKFDVVFPVVHGTLCEDGTLQGLLTLADLPFVGCGVLASAVGMDKDIAKRLAMQAGVPVAPYVSIKLGEWKKHAATFLKQIQNTLSYPLFVKPANAGSSIGISKVKNSHALEEAIQEAFQFDTKILVEQGLNAQELELAVLESKNSGDEPIVSVVGEIAPSHEFYSYEAKYQDENGAALFIPANVNADIAEKAKQMAVTIFKSLDCEGLARVDLFLDKNTQSLYFNEINTLPGFTKISMYPKLMEASGMSYASLLTHLIELALKRHQEKNGLVRSHLTQSA